MTVQNTEYYQIPTLWYLSFKGLLIEILVRSINVSKITVPPKSPQHSWQFTKSGFLEHIAQVAKYIGEYFFKLPFQESLEGSWSLQAAGMVCLLILNVGWSECLFFFFSVLLAWEWLSATELAYLLWKGEDCWILSVSGIPWDCFDLYTILLKLFSRRMKYFNLKEPVTHQICTEFSMSPCLTRKCEP